VQYFADALLILLEEVLWQAEMSIVLSPVRAMIEQTALDPKHLVVPDESFLQRLRLSV
jgi:hypothetical protein